jgi:hypothetical protein
LIDKEKAAYQTVTKVFMTSSWLFYDFFRAFTVRSVVGARNEMSLAYQKTLTPASGLPDPREAGDAEARLSIDVVFTSVEATLVALRRAAELANRLAARITLFVPQVVPYPLPLESPPVLLDWSERRFRVIAEESPVETAVQIYLCRDRAHAIASVLKPRSIVVVGGRKRWWPTAEMRLARRLRAEGHEVIFADTKYRRQTCCFSE